MLYFGRVSSLWLIFQNIVWYLADWECDSSVLDKLKKKLNQIKQKA